VPNAGACSFGANLHPVKRTLNTVTIAAIDKTATEVAACLLLLPFIRYSNLSFRLLFSSHMEAVKGKGLRSFLEIKSSYTA
jgi:hypothetical protein